MVTTLIISLIIIVLVIVLSAVVTTKAYKNQAKHKIDQAPEPDQPDDAGKSSD